MTASIIHWKRKRSIRCVLVFCGNSRRKNSFAAIPGEAEDRVLFIKEEQKVEPSNLIVGGAFKKVSIHIADDECSSHSPLCFTCDEDSFSKEDTECDGDNEGKPFSCCAKKEKLLFDVKKELRKHQLSYRKLVARERQWDVNDLSSAVIAACVNKK